MQVAGFVGVVNQISEWLDHAAEGTLIHPEQGWEPVRRDDLPHWIAADATRLRAMVDGTERFQFLPFAYTRWNLGSTEMVDGWLGTETTPVSARLAPNIFSRRVIDKERYKEFLLGKVPSLEFPTADKEKADPAAADGAYRSAVRWLVDNTRSVKRVQQENIAYGFRRNLYGLKPWGLLAAIAAAVIAGVVLWLRHGMAIETIPAEALVVFAFDAVVLPVMWTIAIRSTWVASTADGYALALFGFCDQAERRPAKEK